MGVLKIIQFLSNIDTMKYRILTILTLMFFTAFHSQAQIATISDDIYIRNEEKFEVIGKVEGHFYIIKDLSEGAKLYCFNPFLKLEWENDIVCEKKNFKVLGTVARPDYFGVIIQFRRKGENIVEFQKLDETGALIDKRIVKNYGRRTFAPKPIVIRSRDKRKFVIYNDRDDDFMEAVSFDTERMEIMWDEGITVNDISLRNELYQMIVNDKGSFFAVMYKEHSKSNRAKNKFLIYEIGNQKKSLTEIPFEGNMLYDVYFDYNNMSNALVGAGLYDDRKMYRASGTFHINIPNAAPSDYTLEFQKIPSGTMSTIRGKESDENDSFNEAYVNELILKSDGGLVMVVERFKKVTQAHTSPLPRTTQSRNPTYTAQAEYHYNDIILFDYDTKGNVNYKEILYKRQYSRDDGGRLSSFFLMKTPQKVRFIYNDEIKSNNKISEYTLMRDGQNERNAILDTDGYDVHLMFKNGMQTSKNEFIVPSLKRKSLKLVRITYGNG